MNQLEKTLSEFEKEFPRRDSSVGEWTIFDKTPHPEQIKAFLTKALQDQARKFLDELEVECVDCDTGEWHTCGVDLEKNQALKEKIILDYNLE